MIDSITKQNELYDLISDSISDSELLNAVLCWMGSDEAAHCLEDIAKEYDLIFDSDAYSGFNEWYDSLNNEDQRLVDQITDDIGLLNYAQVTEEQFSRILDIFELMKS